MARTFPFEVYTKFRFYLQAARKPVEFGAQHVSVDPFTMDLWIGSAHKVGVPSLCMILSEETEIKIWLMPYAKGQGPCRLLRVKFDGFDYLPIDLDARESRVALEWVRLKNAQYMAPVDVNFDNLPPEIAAEVDPRKKTEMIG